MQYILEYKDWLGTTQQVNIDSVNEEWGFEDSLHLVWDVVDAAADVIVPGSGSVLDFIHAATFFIEAAVENAKQSIEKNKVIGYIICGIITLSMIFALGPLKSAGIQLKAQAKAAMEAVANGAKVAEKGAAHIALDGVTKSINSITGLLGQISKAISDFITKFANSDLGKWIIKRFGGIDKAIVWFNQFMAKTVPTYLSDFLKMIAKINPTSAEKAVVTGAEKVVAGAEKAAVADIKAVSKAGGKAGAISISGTKTGERVKDVIADNKDSIKKNIDAISAKTNSIISQFKIPSPVVNQPISQITPGQAPNGLL